MVFVEKGFHESAANGDKHIKWCHVRNKRGGPVEGGRVAGLKAFIQSAVMKSK